MMRIFGLIGFPLSHSFSKKYFDQKFASEQITDANFFLYPIPKIQDVVSLIQSTPNLQGLAVTIPYKKQIIPYVNKVSAEVQEMQACNCVHIQQGELSGYNTDVIGFKKSLLQQLQPHHNGALILGTGGAAAAVAIVFNELKIPFQFVSRHPLSHHNCIAYKQINEMLLGLFPIIVNTTPFGTFPDVNNCPPIPYEFLSAKNYLFDLVYNPGETLFLKKGKEKGCLVQNGYDMLVGQAEANWEIWNSY
jgi:shikimate dehydrogenase